MQQNQTGKTKTAMLLELESIKDLLIEADNIPILQEVVQPLVTNPEPGVKEPCVGEVELLDTASANEDKGDTQARNQDTPQQRIVVVQQQTPLAEPSLTVNRETGNFIIIPEEISSQNTESPSLAIPLETSPTHYREEQQQDFFPQSLDQEPLTENTSPHSEASSAPANIKTGSTRPTPQKASGQNPFLPEHIRARLQGNNPALLSGENSAKNSSRTALTATATQPKTSGSQQQLVDEMVEKLLPAMEKELRSHLQTMSKRMLEDLLDDKNHP
ncbi:MAG TPA: hypothetical protein VN030_12005 [Cellvibrio sp.]|nr:hypothetical protein [Cellvibrio sp.]